MNNTYNTGDESKLRLVGKDIKRYDFGYTSYAIVRFEDKFIVGLDGKILTEADVKNPLSFSRANEAVSTAYLLGKLVSPVFKDSEGYDLPIYVLSIQKKLDRLRVKFTEDQNPLTKDEARILSRMYKDSKNRSASNLGA